MQRIVCVPSIICFFLSAYRKTRITSGEPAPFWCLPVESAHASWSYWRPTLAPATSVRPCASPSSVDFFIIRIIIVPCTPYALLLSRDGSTCLYLAWITERSIILNNPTLRFLISTIPVFGLTINATNHLSDLGLGTRFCFMTWLTAAWHVSLRYDIFWMLSGKSL